MAPAHRSDRAENGGAVVYFDDDPNAEFVRGTLRSAAEFIAGLGRDESAAVLFAEADKMLPAPPPNYERRRRVADGRVFDELVRVRGSGCRPKRPPSELVCREDLKHLLPGGGKDIEKAPDELPRIRAWLRRMLRQSSQKK